MSDEVNARDLLVLKSLIVNSEEKHEIISMDHKIPKNDVGRIRKKLVSSGIIKSFTVDVDYGKIGFGVSAMYLLKMKERNAEYIESIEHFLLANKNVVDISTVFGPSVDYVIRIVAESLERVEEIIDHLADARYNIDTDKSFAMVIARTVKKSIGPHVDLIGSNSH